MTKRITIRLGNLTEPLAAAAAAAGCSEIEYARRLIAKGLRVKHEPYQPDPGHMAKEAAAKRWGK